MLRSSHVIKPAAATTQVTPRRASNTLRKSKSSDSVSTTPRAPQNKPNDTPSRTPQTTGRFLGAAMRSSISLGRHPEDEATPANATTRQLRGLSLDVSKHSSKGHLPLSLSDGTGKKVQKGWSKDMAPSRYATVFTSTSSLELDVEIVKKLRLMLRNESAR